MAEYWSLSNSAWGLTTEDGESYLKELTLATASRPPECGWKALLTSGGQTQNWWRGRGEASELRVVLLGNSYSQRSTVGNFILKEPKFNTEDEPDFLTVRAQLKRKEIVVINTPDLLLPNMSEDNLRTQIESCVSLSSPGPHVFLLVLQPEHFTEEDNQRLCRVLQLFGSQSFDHSLILMVAPREESSASVGKGKLDPHLTHLIRTCRYRYLRQEDLERAELLTRLGQTAKENDGEYFSYHVFEDEGLVMTVEKSTLNLYALHKVSQQEYIRNRDYKHVDVWLDQKHV